MEPIEEAEDILVRIAYEVSVPHEEKLSEIMERICAAIAVAEDLAPSEVSITVVDEETIQAYNNTYRMIDAPTDVLSFSMLETTEEEIEFETLYDRQMLGDLIICWEKTERQALEYGHSVERELAFLTAHGMFHLLGYDHQIPDEEAAMMRKQEEVLTALGFVR
ncbi:rRNA maturation RNase YbeY [Ferroacidibacillus organovorans]|nr:rRNA maturation RNase YbeY [Ferroacidibacillus organovorans]